MKAFNSFQIRHGRQDSVGFCVANYLDYGNEYDKTTSYNKNSR